MLEVNSFQWCKSTHGGQRPKQEEAANFEVFLGPQGRAGALGGLDMGLVPDVHRQYGLGNQQGQGQGPQLLSQMSQASNAGGPQLPEVRALLLLGITCCSCCCYC